MSVCQSRICIVFSLLGALYSDNAYAGGDPAKIVDMVADIQLVATLYGRFEPAVKVDALPKFAAKKLAEYANDQEPTAKERYAYNLNRDKYASDYPLRAVVFASADEMDRVKKLFLPMTVLAPLDPKKKQAFFLKVQEPAKALFELQQILEQTKLAEGSRAKEKSKRWHANFDFAQTRILANLIFLYEYSFTLGQIRADNLPTLGNDHDGWRIVMRPRVTVPEKNAKDYYKALMKRLKSIQEMYPDTPWAYFAEREGRRDLGMEWVPKKK